MDTARTVNRRISDLALSAFALAMGLGLLVPLPAHAITSWTQCQQNCRYQYRQWLAHCQMDNQNIECQNQAIETFDQCRGDCNNQFGSSSESPELSDSPAVGRSVSPNPETPAVGAPAGGAATGN